MDQPTLTDIASKFVTYFLTFDIGYKFTTTTPKTGPNARLIGVKFNDSCFEKSIPENLG